MTFFRKKPVVIEAVQFTGYTDELVAFIMGIDYSCEANDLIIHTLEGNMRAIIGDWIIKGISGEFYPCKPDIFEKTYEKI
jgi:hypothetical protein